MIRIALASILLAACGAPARPPAAGIYVRDHARWPFQLSSIAVYVDGAPQYARHGAGRDPAWIARLPQGAHVVFVDAALHRPCAPSSRALETWRVRSAMRVTVSGRAQLLVEVAARTLDAEPNVRWSVVPIEGASTLDGPAPWPFLAEPSETFGPEGCAAYEEPSLPAPDANAPPFAPVPPYD